MARYYGLLSALYGVTFVAFRLNAALFVPHWARWWEHPVPWIHVALTVATTASWFVLSRREWDEQMLDRADFFNVVEQGVLLALVIVASQDREPLIATEMVLAMAHILASRAAIVPSTPTRTAFLGACALLPFPIALAWMLAHVAPGALPRAGISYVVALTIWSAVGVATSTAIGYVVYGLERQVREARRLGQYTLERKIGEGGMGVVYRARHALLRRPTAVKLLKPALADGRALARFEREVQRTAELTSPHTIAVFDYGRTPEGLFYYAMEYLDGFDLHTMVRLDGPMPAGRVAHLLAQAASALAEAHHVGLIHRDVKPSNLVVTRRGMTPDFLKVLDFGLVREARRDADPRLSQVDAIEGTPLFMSPEQAVDPHEVDARSDLYGLGAVGYFLLTGAPPFDGDTAIEVVSKHLHAPLVPASERVDAVPASLDALLSRCLAKEVEGRPASANELLAGLAALDDVVPWTAADAERWWAERAPALRERLAVEAQARHGEVSGSGETIFVDLDRRDSKRASFLAALDDL